MVIVSAKVSKRKILAGILAAVCVISLLALLLARSKEPAPAPQEDPAQSLDGSSPESRKAFLESFGWQVEDAPRETQEVRIPREFNEVFARYNELQQSQGFDLTDYAGKAAKRYVYAVTNHPLGDGHFATVLVYRGKIIGGDITGTGEDGSVHGFVMAQ